MIRILPLLVLACAGCAGELSTRAERAEKGGRSAGELVGAAVAAGNGKHRMVGTLGPPAGQGTMKNTRHEVIR